MRRRVDDDREMPRAISLPEWNYAATIAHGRTRPRPDSNEARRWIFTPARKPKKRLKTRRHFLYSVAIKSIDAARVRQCADDYARRLLADHPDVEEIIIFGSFANDTYAPGSDLDVFHCSKSCHPARARACRRVPAREFSGSGGRVSFHPSGNRSALFVAIACRGEEKPMAICEVMEWSFCSSDPLLP